MILSWLGWMLAVVGTLLFGAGTLGLLRFPDVYTRLHALAKADTLGLGFICLGVGLCWADLRVALKLVLVWLLVLAAGAVLSTLIGRAARDEGEQRWEGR